MTGRDDMSQEPWRFDFFDTMRRIERERTAYPPPRPEPVPDQYGDLPPAPIERGRVRIGRAASRRDEYVLLGQDPYFAFPASNLTAVSQDAEGRDRILVRFLGLLGPMGALPLVTTEEAYGWWLSNDDAFPRFLDIFNHKFLQLFFRTWADARPIVQHDFPEQDRFVAYVGSTVGLGSEPFHDLDSVPDTGKLAFAGLLGAKAKSASRLRGALQGLFGTKVTIEEFVGSRLELDASDRSLIGGRLTTLGVDMMIGSSFYSVQDRIRIQVSVKDMTQYARFLPDGDLCGKFVDMVFFCLGDEIDWDLELAIPASKVLPGQLGGTTRLGWTSWLSPDLADPGERTDARFAAAQRVAKIRTQRSASVQ